MVEIHPGPVVTTYEFKPDAGVKYSKIVGLADDLALALEAESIRIDRMSGRGTVGIEIPNEVRETISLRQILESDAFRKSSGRLTLALGKTVGGDPYVTDLAAMPHLLIAGSTGTGKSVGLNCMIASILFKSTPDEVRMILIDPKRLELGVYEDIPHLLTPVVTDPKMAANVLKWAVGEMEKRIRKLASEGVRNIEQFNNIIRAEKEERKDEDGEALKPLHYIVIIIDELADLMMVSSHEVEEAITRLAQMARAVGIHLILATQRPSVDVLTGLIKANFPSRISFRVAARVDSRTILDSIGAEHLLGKGDMLFLPPGSARLAAHPRRLREREGDRAPHELPPQDRRAHLRRHRGQAREGAGGGGGPGARRALRRGGALRGPERPGLDQHAAAALPHRLLARGPPRRHDGAGRDHRPRRRVEVARDPGARGLLRDGGPLAEVTRSFRSRASPPCSCPRGSSSPLRRRPRPPPARRGARPQAPEAQAPARPDAALYEEAKQARATLEASPAPPGVAARSGTRSSPATAARGPLPQERLRDDALLAVGDLYRAMAKRFKKPALRRRRGAGLRDPGRRVPEQPPRGDGALLHLRDRPGQRRQEAAARGRPRLPGRLPRRGPGGER